MPARSTACAAPRTEDTSPSTNVLWTKALLFRDGRLLRELNRSYYHAESFEYPLTFLPLPNGRMGIVHCPDDVGVLEMRTLRRVSASRVGPEMVMGSFILNCVQIHPEIVF